MMNIDEYINKGLIHSIHTSERKAFRACRRRWAWSYREGYHPTVTPKPLEFGIAYHTAMEVWYDPEMWLKDREVQSSLAISAFNQVCTDQLKNFVNLNGNPNDEVLADYAERVDLGVAMVEYYTRRVSPKLDKGLTPLAVEIPFEVPMDMWCKCDTCWNLFITYEHGVLVSNSLKEAKSHGSRCWCVDESNEHPWENWREEHWQGLPVTFGGRIDAIFQDLEMRTLVFDWKTTARILDDADESAFLELDDQVGGYPVALYKLGRRVDGFIYHEQRKAVPGPPKQLKRPYQGKLFSVDATAPVEYETFLNTILREDLPGYNNGLYDKYLEHLQSPMAPKFFQRHTIYKTTEQLENFWSDLKLEAKDMLGNPNVYPQPSRFSCNKCLYRQPCEGRNRGEDYKYTLDSLYVRSRS